MTEKGGKMNGSVIATIKIGLVVVALFAGWAGAYATFTSRVDQNGLNIKHTSKALVEHRGQAIRQFAEIKEELKDLSNDVRAGQKSTDQRLDKINDKLARTTTVLEWMRDHPDGR